MGMKKTEETIAGHSVSVAENDNGVQIIYVDNQMIQEDYTMDQVVDLLENGDTPRPESSGIAMGRVMSHVGWYVD